MGLQLTKPHAPFGLPLSVDQWLYLVLPRLRGGPLLGGDICLAAGSAGRSIAIRDHPIAAETMGVNAPLYKTTCFGVSALYAGVAGGLSAIVVGFVSPDSFGLPLSLAFLVGIVVGGLASLGGMLFGALFIEFVPNIADQLTVNFGESAKALPGAIYGVLLILVMAVMPQGVAGAARAAASVARRVLSLPRSVRSRAGAWRRRIARSVKRYTRERDDDHPAFIPAIGRGRRGVRRQRRIGASGERAGVTDAEIKIGQTMPYSGPALGLWSDRQTDAAYFKMINEQGGVNGRKINLISLDDGYSPPKTVEQTRRLVEQEQVAFIFGSIGTPTNSAVRPYLNENKVPQLFVATGASEERPRTLPVDNGLDPELPDRGGHLRETYSVEQARRKSAYSIRTTTSARTF